MSSASATGRGGLGPAKPKAGPAKDGGVGGKGKGVAVVPEAKRKIEASGKTVSLVKQKSVTVAGKSEKGKTTTTSSKTVTKKTVRTKAEKKVFSLPGQKYDPPEEREPLRIFYESLSKQIPSSEMAEFWMMEHGLLSPERAKKAYDRKMKRLQQQRLGTPIKSTKQERAESSKKPLVSKNGDAKTKKRANLSDDDDDFIIKSKKAKSRNMT